MYFISLDACSGYHQIRVQKYDQEKLVFFTPSGKKKTLKVMSFAPKNAPAFYTAMMQFLRDDWNIFFKWNTTQYPTFSITDEYYL